MKTIRSMHYAIKNTLIASALSCMSLTAQADVAPTIADLVVDTSGGVSAFDSDPNDFDILLDAAIRLDLVPTLADPNQSLTVFGPTDAAFLALASDLAGHPVHDESSALTVIANGLETLAITDVTATLTNVLLYHVSNGVQDLHTLQASTQIETLFNGEIIKPQGELLRDKDAGLTDPTLIAGDLFTGNGVVHVIDRVLIPVDLTGSGQTNAGNNNTSPTIVDLVLTSNNDGIDDGNLADFDILLQAVLATGLEGALSDPNLDATVFAPNDQAFIRLAQDLGYPGHDEQGSFDFIAGALPLETITEVLLYHVSPGAKTYRQIRHSWSIDTLLNGQSFHVFWGHILLDEDPGIINPRLLRGANVEAANGRIQVISRVLMPVNITGKTIGPFQQLRAVFSKI